MFLDHFQGSEPEKKRSVFGFSGLDFGFFGSKPEFKLKNPKSKPENSKFKPESKLYKIRKIQNPNPIQKPVFPIILENFLKKNIQLK